MAVAEQTYTPRLKQRYVEEIRDRLKDELGYASIMEVPRVSKITLNMGVGEAKTEAKLLDAAMEQLTTIAGQRAQLRRARKSIASFKLREGMAVGARVTLRGARMYEFLDRFITVSVPRMRDFRGLPTKSFDGRGNYTVGIKEQMLFPEIDYDKVEQIHGMDITFVTNAGRDDTAMALLREMGMPFRGESPVAVG
jgi:large subunit ribosomal protein L5